MRTEARVGLSSLTGILVATMVPLAVLLHVLVCSSYKVSLKIPLGAGGIHTNVDTAMACRCRTGNTASVQQRGVSGCVRACMAPLRYRYCRRGVCARLATTLACCSGQLCSTSAAAARLSACSTSLVPLSAFLLGSQPMSLASTLWRTADTIRHQASNNLVLLIATQAHQGTWMSWCTELLKPSLFLVFLGLAGSCSMGTK